jgi:hypothetical protein
LRTTSRRVIRPALAVAALLVAAGCGGGSALDYGTQSINTSACTGFSIALYSPTGTSVATTTSQIIVSISPQTAGPAESPGSYELLLQSHSGSTSDTLGTPTVTSPTGAPSGYTYLSANIPSADLPLAGATIWDVSLYNPSSTCELSSFAEFTTS